MCDFPVSTLRNKMTRKISRTSDENDLLLEGDCEARGDVDRRSVPTHLFDVLRDGHRGLDVRALPRVVRGRGGRRHIRGWCADRGRLSAERRSGTVVRSGRSVLDEDDSASSARAGPSDRPHRRHERGSTREARQRPNVHAPLLVVSAPLVVRRFRGRRRATRSAGARFFVASLFSSRASIRASGPSPRAVPLARTARGGEHVTPARGVKEGASIAMRCLGAGRSAAGVDS